MFRKIDNHTGDEEKTGLLELLKEDDALSLMSTGEDDKHGSGGDRLSEGLHLRVSANLGGSVKNVILLEEGGLQKLR